MTKTTFLRYIIVAKSEGDVFCNTTSFELTFSFRPSDVNTCIGLLHESAFAEFDNYITNTAIRPKEFCGDKQLTELLND